MRRDTKIAVLVAVVFVGLGVWYVMRGTGSSEPATAKDEPTGAVAKSGNKPSPTATAKHTNVNLPRSPRLTPPSSANRNLSGTASRPAGSGGSATGGPGGTVMASARPSALGASASGMGSATTQPGATSARPSLSAPLTSPVRPAASPGAGSIGLAGSGSASGSTAGPTPALANNASATGTKTHVVQAGDTFSSLATKYFGHARHAGLIAKANPAVDPRKMRIGTKLTIPAGPEGHAAMAGPSPTPGPTAAPTVRSASGDPSVGTPITRGIRVAPIPADRAYTVQSGEGWYTLAERFLGDGKRWTELYELNKERVPHDPKGIAPGTVIELPKEAKMKAVAAPTTRPASTVNR